jgi:flagellar assembly protein FliH
MSSKLLGGDGASGAQPITWRRAGLGPLPHSNGLQEDGSISLATADVGQPVTAQERRILELEHELQQRMRQAHDQGFSEGHAAGAQQASQALDPLLARAAKTVEELTALRRKVRADAEEDAVRLAIAVARKILNRELMVDSEALLGLVKATLQRVDARELHRMRANPSDIPALERHLQAIGMPVRLEVIADPQLERGAVIFETARGTLDGSAMTQLQEIERGFIDVVRRTSDAV